MSNQAQSQLQVFSTREAAKYLRVSVPTIKHHVYKTRRLVPDGRIGQNLLFNKETLDRFNADRTGQTDSAN
jgi:excisionase family DNA binding protein